VEEETAELPQVVAISHGGDLAVLLLEWSDAPWGMSLPEAKHGWFLIQCPVRAVLIADC